MAILYMYKSMYNIEYGVSSRVTQYIVYTVYSVQIYDEKAVIVA